MAKYCSSSKPSTTYLASARSNSLSCGAIFRWQTYSFIAVIHPLAVILPSLSQVDIFHLGCQLLAFQLAAGSPLNTLDLSSNSISSEGVGLICEALCRNSYLRLLNIAHHNIDSTAMIHLSRMLAHNTILTHPNVSYTYISGEDFRPFIDWFIHNPSIMSLPYSLNFNNSTHSSIETDSNDQPDHHACWTVIAMAARVVIVSFDRWIGEQNRCIALSCFTQSSRS